jgi:hypothetical protein
MQHLQRLLLVFRYQSRVQILFGRERGSRWGMDVLAGATGHLRWKKRRITHLLRRREQEGLGGFQLVPDALEGVSQSQKRHGRPTRCRPPSKHSIRSLQPTPQAVCRLTVKSFCTPALGLREAARHTSTIHRNGP